MNRLHEYVLDGKTYPLTLSIRAAKELTARHGSISGIFGAIAFGAENEADNLIHALKLLNEQAVAYKKLIDGESVAELPSVETLEVCMSLEDARAARKAIADTIDISLNVTVETEQDEKNAETTQE